MKRIPNGTRVRLPDGTEALAYHDGDGTYRTAQILHGVERRDMGWRREFLEVISDSVVH